jgi:S1-C subfamily serine protease
LRLPPGGVLLIYVQPGSNAALADILAGDVLLRYAGVDLTAPTDLPKAVSAHEKDKRIEVVVWRDGVSNTRDVARIRAPSRK